MVCHIDEEQSILCCVSPKRSLQKSNILGSSEPVAGIVATSDTHTDPHTLTHTYFDT